MSISIGQYVELCAGVILGGATRLDDDEEEHGRGDKCPVEILCILRRDEEYELEVRLLLPGHDTIGGRPDRYYESDDVRLVRGSDVEGEIVVYRGDVEDEDGAMLSFEENLPVYHVGGCYDTRTGVLEEAAEEHGTGGTAERAARRPRWNRRSYSRFVRTHGFDPYGGDEDDENCKNHHEREVHGRTAALHKSVSDLLAPPTTGPVAPLIGRETEHMVVERFLKNALKLRSRSSSSPRTTGGVSGGRIMFISGPPGTGKTATVLNVIANLQQENLAKQHPASSSKPAANGFITNFHFVTLNGMELSHPHDAYVRLWLLIDSHLEKSAATFDGDNSRPTGRRFRALPPEVASKALENHFSHSRHSGTTMNKDACWPVVLLVDEIDYLVTPKQTVLYDLFDWPSKEGGAPLIIVAISNTINLPDTLLPRVQSRMGLTNCPFKAYSADQVTNILKTKLAYRENDPGENCKKNVAFDIEAIKFGAKRTAAASGDIRYAFKICRDAASLVIEDIEHHGKERSNIVSVPDINSVSTFMQNQPIQKSIRTCVAFEALIIVSLASLKKVTGRERGGNSIGELHQKMEAVANGFGDWQYLPVPKFGELTEMVNRLGDAGILQLELPPSISSARQYIFGGDAEWPLVYLNVHTQDVIDALRVSPHNKLSEKYLI
uniref:Origin recognition complex subunit 1 n=1 Tax=Corethron hystrix TaxID=216773 RepID=A0A7S1B3H3_9STRA|mmetsp:Transcript_11044/g.24354  ORF Transcript_11044/g.24354 Transcript_11044/m.24354 type:complete len:664 (+) Transcript_11044:1563-3554(+)